MIEFDCQHCGKRFAVHDDLAGREGWCRSCKKMIVVPHPSGVRFIEDMPVEERFTRMHRLLMIAATKAEKYKKRVKELEDQEVGHHSTPPPQFEIDTENTHFEERINELEQMLTVVTVQHETDVKIQSDQSLQIEILTNENTKLQSRLTEQDPLHDQLLDLEKKLYQLSEEKSSIAEELAALQTRNLELTAYKAQVQSDYDKYQSKSEAEIIKLQSELSLVKETLQKRDSAIDALHEKELEWKRRADSAQETFHGIEKQLSDTQLENTLLLGNAKTLEDNVESLKNDKNHIELKLSEVNAENLQLQSEFKKLQIESNSHRIELENENAFLKEKLINLNEELNTYRLNPPENTLKQAIHVLEKKLADKENEVTELFLEIDRKRIEIQDEQAARSNTEMLLNNADMLLNEYKAEIAVLRNQIDEVKSRYSKTKDALKAQEILLENSKRLVNETNLFTEANELEPNTSDLNNGYVEIVDNEDSLQDQINYMGSDALIEVVQHMQEDEQREMMLYLQRFIDQKK